MPNLTLEKLQVEIINLRDKIKELENIISTCIKSGDKVTLQSNSKKFLRHDWSSGLGLFDRLEAKDSEYFKLNKG